MFVNAFHCFINGILMILLVSAQNFAVIFLCLCGEIELINAFDACECISLLFNGNLYDSSSFSSKLLYFLCVYVKRLNWLITFDICECILLLEGCVISVSHPRGVCFSPTWNLGTGCVFVNLLNWLISLMFINAFYCSLLELWTILLVSAQKFGIFCKIIRRDWTGWWI